MNIGLFGARSDRRGLAALSDNIIAGLCPSRVLNIDMGRHRPFPADPRPHQTLTYDEVMRMRDLDHWLDGLDVVLTLETPYHPDLYDACRRRGVLSVLLAMPEYLDPAYKPDVIALPTPWLAERHPGCPVLEVGVEPFATMPGDAILHPAGSPARGDRNGTTVVLEASRILPAPWLVRAQSPPTTYTQTAQVIVADCPTRQQVYDDAAIVVIPRRYGGLSLAIADSLAAGLPTLIPDNDPYASALHPACWLPSSVGKGIRTVAGHIPTYDVDPADLATTVADLRSNDRLRAECADSARKWARAHSWSHLRPHWLDVLSGLG